MFKDALQLIEEFVAKRDTSAAVVLIEHQGHIISHAAYGHLSFFPEAQQATADTIFDFASLTKIVSTTTIALRLIEEGLFKLDDEIGQLIQDVPLDKQAIKIEHLLTHTSGLPATFPLYQNPKFKDPKTALQTVLEVPLERPIASSVEYSCVGYILLGFIMENLSKSSLDRLYQDLVANPLELTDTSYNPAKNKLNRIAYTEWDPEQKVFLQGQVHDENARALGGISGNAGLFGTAPELGRFAIMIRQEGCYKNKQILRPETLRLLQKDYTLDPTEPRTLGWLLPSKIKSSGGFLLSDQSLGHTGFTGTSLWIDFKRQFSGILLTNRVHPTRSNTNLIQLRPRFYEAICTAIDRL